MSQSWVNGRTALMAPKPQISALIKPESQINEEAFILSVCAINNYPALKSANKEAEDIVLRLQAHFRDVYFKRDFFLKGCITSHTEELHKAVNNTVSSGKLSCTLQTAKVFKQRSLAEHMFF